MTACRICRNTSLTEVIDLGDQFLPDFVPVGTPLEDPWPLKLMICPECTLVQLDESTPRSLLYHDRYGFRSGTNEAIRADLEEIVKYVLAVKSNLGVGIDRWLDIACNDGTLLSYVPKNIHRTGIDPVQAIARDGMSSGFANRMIYNFFGSRFFAPREFDVITSVSMFYDLPAPGKFVHEVSNVLATDGVWVIQQNYAGDMISQNAVDNICHEHITYFALLPLMRLLGEHGLEINDVTFSSVNGGCIRTLVSHAGARPVSSSVAEAVQTEVRRGLHRPEIWQAWGRAVRQELGLTRNFLERAQSQGKRVYLYGASTRGGTFLQMIDAGPWLLRYAVERNPDKVGKIMASTGIPIISEEEMRADPPDYLLVSPWFFRDVFLEREREYLDRGGRMAFPLPHFEIVRRTLGDLD
jgi:NDP-4-keto-2,6-dideoxyhexose 3-C-methyltransferase